MFTSQPRISPSCPIVPVNFQHRSGSHSARMGKVAIIRDMAAVTYASPAVHCFLNLTFCSFEAMIYFLYTGKIVFAPLSSDPRCEVPAEARTGDWNIARLPSPSAKSIYRLADKVKALLVYGFDSLIDSSTIYRSSKDMQRPTSTTM